MAGGIPQKISSFYQFGNISSSSLSIFFAMISATLTIVDCMSCSTPFKKAFYWKKREPDWGSMSSWNLMVFPFWSILSCQQTYIAIYPPTSSPTIPILSSSICSSSADLIVHLTPATASYKHPGTLLPGANRQLIQTIVQSHSTAYRFINGL